MSKTLRKSKKGFTLIELMIVVAIIGILAAIAIPNFLRFQLKAKSAEAKVNVAAIRTTETGFHAEIGQYVSAAQAPPTSNGPLKQAFDPASAGFSTIGWSPEGQVYFQYAVATSADNIGYSVGSTADIDGDATFQEWGFAKPNGGGTRQAVIGCSVATNFQDNTVMACEPTHGQSVF